MKWLDFADDMAMFCGMVNYNEMLLQDGNVQSEMILKKDPSEFTLSGAGRSRGGSSSTPRVCHVLV
jgi:hypothetical protein